MIQIDIRKSDKCNGDVGLFLTTPYDQSIITIIKNQPTRYYNANTKEWEIPASRLYKLIEELYSYEIEVRDMNHLVFKKPVKTDSEPVVFNFKTTPFQHQVDGFKYGTTHTRWLLGDEQGLGKTKQVIDIAVANKQKYGYKHCLIVCGVNSLKWNWQNEISIHSNETGWILGQRRQRNGKLVIGKVSDRLDDLNNLDKIDSYFLITNIETLRDESIITKLVALCKAGKISMVAADEVHKMKNPTCQQGKHFLKLQAKNMIAMTGTPLMNTPMDLYIILKWLGYEKHSFSAFKKHYCVMGGFGGYEVIGYRYMDELQEQLDSMMLRRLKNDVLDLPEKMYIDDYVEMTAKQAQLYREIDLELCTNIDKIKMATNPLAELIRLRQATGYTGILSSTIEESAKLDRMEELVEDAVANGQKVVVFSNWSQITDEAVARLQKKYKVGSITGNTKDNERQTLVNKFQNDPNFKVIVGTMGAMGTGLTLTAGTVMVFLDHPWNRALYDQAVDRCHRIGQKNQLTIYNILCRDTIDERIWNIVQKKGAISDALVDGDLGKNKEEIVNFLLGL